MAQTSNPLPAVNTVDYYGYNKIIDNIADRGFGPLVLKAEKYINLVTVPK